MYINTKYTNCKNNTVPHIVQQQPESCWCFRSWWFHLLLVWREDIHLSFPSSISQCIALCPH